MSVKKTRKLLWWSAIVLFLTAVDQLTKYLVRIRIPLGGSVELLPGIMDLTYVKNTGMAFSLLSEHTWLLAVCSLVVIAVLLALLIRQEITHPMGVAALLLIVAGAVGNLIDRVVLGWVTDMFRTLFVDFAVFNVADICVTVGAVLFAAYYLFLFDKYEKRGKKHDRSDADR